MDCPNPKRRSAAAAVPSLPEDAILDILERVPARSIHRFKCVSRRWIDLISDPAHRKRFPQTLEGFFCSDADDCYSGKFIRLPGMRAPLFDPSLSSLTKLPGNKNIVLLNSCGGLLLFGHGAVGGIDAELGYIVCNPATEQWLAVDSAGCPAPEDCAPTYIIFDPAVSPHFHLIHLWQDSTIGMIEVRIYSSETGLWVNCPRISMRTHEDELDDWEQWCKGGPASMGNTFVNGKLHFIIFQRDTRSYLIAGLDWEGNLDTLRYIIWPDMYVSSAIFLGQSQGHLYCMSGYQEGNGFYHCGISIWVLQDYNKEEWVLKHSVTFFKLFGQKKLRVHVDYNVIGMHPDCNWIFLVHHCNRKLIAYDMDSKKVHTLGTIKHSYRHYAPYIPYYSELSVLGANRQRVLEFDLRPPGVEKLATWVARLH
ncbi:hypothetical protein BS78_01G085600 [Paspalum vaginatum]|nr:hypothetical protein BS78_01G085600 [Paspalum vaginatum]